MLIGSIRYSYTAKEKAKEQGIQHLVYPRFTRTVPPRGVITGKMHPSERPDIKVGKINVDEQPELASKFGIMSIPTLVVMKNGKIVTKVSGARPKKAILEML